MRLDFGRALVAFAASAILATSVWIESAGASTSACKVHQTSTGTYFCPNYPCDDATPCNPVNNGLGLLVACACGSGVQPLCHGMANRTTGGIDCEDIMCGGGQECWITTWYPWPGGGGGPPMGTPVRKCACQGP